METCSYCLKPVKVVACDGCCSEECSKKLKGSAMFTKKACIKKEVSVFGFERPRYSRFNCKFPEHQMLVGTSQKPRLLVPFWANVNEKNNKAINEGRAELIFMNGYRLGWASQHGPTEVGRGRLKGLFQFAKKHTVKPEDGFIVRLAKVTDNLKVYARFERKLLDPSTSFPVVRYFRNSSFGLTENQRVGLEHPANDAFRGIFEARKHLGTNFLNMLECLVPAINLVAKRLDLVSLKEALEKDEEQLAVYKDVEPKGLMDEATMLEETGHLLDEFDGQDDPDMINVTAVRNRIRDMHLDSSYRGEKDETFHKIFVLLHRIYKNDHTAFEPLADILSQVTFDARQKDMKGKWYRQDWQKMPSYQNHNMVVNHRNIYRDTYEMPDLVQPKDEDGMYMEDPEKWADKNTIEWQNWIEELDNWEYVTATLEEGAESYTDSPQYSYFRYLVEVAQPWVRSMRNLRRPFCSKVAALINRSQQLRMELKEEMQYRKDFGQAKKTGLVEEGAMVLQQLQEELTLAFDKDKPLGNILDAVDELQASCPKE